jgi:hypothetical protein
MSRRRMSKAEGQALAALFVALLVVAWALLVATIKAAGAILRWIGVTAADLHSTDPARNQRGRARLATVMSAVLVLAGYAVVSAHSTRTLWHESHASWEFMGLAAVIAVGSLVVLTWRVATGFAATIPWKFALVFFVPAMLLASVVWATDRPTLASAQRQLHASQFDAARESAAAIVALDGSSPAVRSLLDRVHELEVLRERDLSQAFVRFRGPWHDLGTRARVAATLHATSVREASALMTGNEAHRLDALATAANTLPYTAQMFRARAVLMRLATRPRDTTDCPAADLLEARAVVPETECAPYALAVRARVAEQYRGQVLEARRLHGHHHEPALRAWTTARSVAQCLARLGGSPDDPTPAEIETRLVDLQARQQQVEAERERQHQREVQEAERREQRRARRSGSRHSDDDDGGGGRCGGRVLCCDGTCSPSCGVNRGSFRGCCSHHGGICG